MSSCIPARLLFSGEDLPFFIEWQQIHTPTAQPGYIRYALDYYRFTNRNAPPRAGTVEVGHHVAVACGHEIHPADSRTMGYCSVCEVKISLKFLDAIAKAWGNAGGPWRNLDVNKNRYGPLSRAWHLARLQHEQLLSPVEAAIEHEAAYITSQPAGAVALSKINTSAKAMRIAQMECKYPAVVSKTAIPVIEKGVKRKVGGEPSEKTKKTVSFAPDTDFDLRRPGKEFKRTSEGYEPGKHAWAPDPNPDPSADPEEEGWEDTSHYTNSIRANTYNLKLFMTTSEHVFAQVREENDLRPGTVCGLVGQYPNCTDIIKHMVAWSQHEDSIEKAQGGSGTRGTLELRMLVQISDALIVWTSA